MLNRLKVEPSVEPVSLWDMRAYLGIVQTADNSRNEQISNHIKAARLWAETYCRIAFITQTWELFLDSFDDEILTLSPLQSVISIKYYDASNVLQTLSSSVYYVDTVGSSVNLVSGQAWPTTNGRKNSVIIEYVCGFTTIPESIKNAIKFMVGNWERFQNNIEGGIISTVPYAVRQLLDYHIDMRGYFQAKIQR